MIQIEDLTLRIAGRALLESASATVPEGAKTGLIGRNGSGKTTLFRAITGDLSPDTGKISLPRGLRVGQVAQEAPGTEESLIEIVLAADQERAELLDRAETEQDPTEIGEIHARLNDIDAHSGEARAAAILSGLGFGPLEQARPASSFSGGWRMRVALAALLFSRPDILLLDEPTNYLDLEGTLWLENFVSRYPGTVLIISHDRDLLNVAVNSILHLENNKLVFYRGNFDGFARQRAEKLELQEKAQVKQAAKRKHLQAFVDRFRAKASKAKQAQSRVKMLEKLEPVSLTLDSRVQPIKFTEPKKLLSSPIIRMEEAWAGYGENAPVLKNIDLRIDQDDRIALLGANGNGKSTLAKLLSGRLEYTGGNITIASNLEVAMFAQHQLDDLIAEQTPVDHLRPLMGGAPDSKIRARAAQMGLDTARMDTKAMNLSGGEKARLLLGLATLRGPHMIILDEPTNHLDMEARESLMMALNAYRGAVILISHDRHLVEGCADRLWLVGDGEVRNFDGDMDEYRALVLSGKRGGGSGKKSRSDKAVKNPAKSVAPAEKRKTLAPLHKQIKQAEEGMTKMRRAIAQIDDRLADPELFITNSERAVELTKKRALAESRLATLEENWLELSANVENAQS